MTSIKSGELFIFEVESKYGLIQIIEKSNASGYNVRIFYDLINDFNENEEAIKRIIYSDRFYFIKDFYESDLINKSLHRMIIELPDEIKMPKYMRASERKINGDLTWFVIDIVKGKVVKKMNSFDDEMIKLSPARTWGIDYIKKRWAEKFTLEKWNDKLEDIWYLEYLRVYEPEKINQFGLKAIKKYPLINKWKSGEKVSKDLVNSFENMLEEFIKIISKNNHEHFQINTSLEILITKLNRLNAKYDFIETFEREEIIEFIYLILDIYNVKDEDDIIERLREW